MSFIDVDWRMLQRADTLRCCARCGDGFVPTRDDRKYCGNGCKQAAARARGLKHLRCWSSELPDDVTRELITALIHYRKLTEAEAEKHPTRVAAELGNLACRLLENWAGRWRSLDAEDPT
jgi:hypothetical protein